MKIHESEAALTLRETCPTPCVFWLRESPCETRHKCPCSGGNLSQEVLGLTRELRLAKAVLASAEVLEGRRVAHIRTLPEHIYYLAPPEFGTSLTQVGGHAPPNWDGTVPLKLALSGLHPPSGEGLGAHVISPKNAKKTHCFVESASAALQSIAFCQVIGKAIYGSRGLCHKAHKCPNRPLLSQEHLEERRKGPV